MDEKELREMIKQRRDEWRIVRSLRLDLRDSLLAGGMSRQKIRRDREYRGLKKKQHHLSRMIIHLEKKFNRKRASRIES